MIYIQLITYEQSLGFTATDNLKENKIEIQNMKYEYN